MASLKFIFMDAGQGDSTLVVYPDDSLMLVDCGSTKNKALVTGEIIKVLRKYLPKTTGGKTIKTLVLTHPDADHYNMLGEVTSTLKIEYEKVIFGGQESEYRAPVGGSGGLLSTIPHVKRFCNQDNAADPHGTPNNNLSRSGVKGWVLAANYPDKAHAQKNDKSVVMLLEYQGVKTFLMGDAVEQTEDMILKRYKGTTLLSPPSSKRVALKVGHHGSPTSSSEAWIKKIKPQVLFISSDTRSFHIPKLSLIDHIKKHTTLHQGNKHVYVYYDDVNTPPGFASKNHAEAVYTTLYKLTPQETGGSYYYTISDDGSVNVSRTD